MKKISTMDENSLQIVNKGLDSNEDSINAEPTETIMTFGEDGLNYSDFENVEYEEIDGEFIGSKQNDEYTSFNALRSSSRKRTRNFSPNEYNVMCGLIEEYSDILELKRNDHKSNTLKNEVWTEITNKFNSSTQEEYRTTLQLRTFYENLKKKRKKLYKDTENCGIATMPDNHLNHKIHLENITKDVPNIQSSFKRRHNNFLDYYQKKKIELVEMEIERVKSATDQQRKLFLLQEQKLMLEIEEIKDRLKNK